MRVQFEVRIENITHAKLLERPVFYQFGIERRIGIGETGGTGEHLSIGQEVHVIAASGTLLGTEVIKIDQRLAIGLSVFPQQRLFLGAIAKLMVDVGINVQTYPMGCHELINGGNQRQVFAGGHDVDMDMEKFLQFFDSRGKALGVYKLAMKAGV